MKTLQRVGLASAAVVGLMSLSAIGSLTTAATASAGPKMRVASTKVTGYTFAEADVSLPADEEEGVTASCPTGDVVVGGGGFEGTQGLEGDINTSEPSGSDGTGWDVFFNNEGTASNSGVAVAICAASGSLTDYSVQYSAEVTVPADGQAQAVVICPSGTVSLGGGAENVGTETSDAMDASAPYGTNGWRSYLSSASSDSTDGFAAVVCAKKPSGWKQVSSHYTVNPVGTATAVTVKCPGGRRVLGGGPFNSSTDPAVNIGLTTSATNLKSWHSTENNESSTSESVDEWAVCAKATATS
jgi:hypothetical protein